MIKQTMTSPFTGGVATLQCEPSTLMFRKETFHYIHQFYECQDSHERFTTSELDEVNLAQVYNQYRAKYGIPFPEDIKSIRQHYGLSATKMSEILGFGENQFRLYENGDMPSEANGKVLMSIMNPTIFRNFIENARGQFSDNEFAKLEDKAISWKEEKRPKFIVEYVFNSSRRTAYNGYASLSIDKLKKYKAIAHGPVPLRWDRIYSFYDEISQEIVQYSDGRAGTKLVSNILPDRTEFRDNELKILEYVYERFKKETPKQISETSHHEEAWLKYLNSDKLINYDMAFFLKAI